MPILVISPREIPASAALAEAAVRSGWQVERLRTWRAPEWLREHEVAVYSEPLFCAVVADTLGVVLLEPPFNWLAELPHAYRQREVRYITLGEARDERERAFIKPVDDKSFPAQVYESGARLPSRSLLPDTIKVLIAEPVVWDVEFRCFVLEGAVATLSPYSRYGELAQADDDTWPASPDEIDQALGFAGAVLADPVVHMPPGVVMDIGKIAGRGWAVVEANAAWGAGLYGCDPARVLPVVVRACVRRERLREQDAAWVVERVN